MLNQDQVKEIIGKYLDDSDIVNINSVDEIYPSFIKDIQRDYNYLNGAELGQLIQAYATLIEEMLGVRGKEATSGIPGYPDYTSRKPDFTDKGIPKTTPTQPGWERKYPSTDIEYDWVGKDKGPYLGKNPGAASMLEPDDLHMPSTGKDIDTLVDEIVINLEDGYIGFDDITDFLEEKYDIVEDIDEILDEVKREIEDGRN